MDDIDYSAGLALSNLLQYLRAKHIRCAFVHVDASVAQLLGQYGITRAYPELRFFPSLEDAMADLDAQPAAEADSAGSQLTSPPQPSH